ncbi:HAD family hydrolase [Shewanella aestuarii]|uniref:HAD family hydrolase n=1 Tax=Shewanella aestuarii TaxID=1028752 RepID=A0A6G9QNC6_9GAMM|nr:HAD family hydrolase [Shewanella aestuarii]QIR15565.1 HAD family hydrolase [Shewanella aestuarii]
MALSNIQGIIFDLDGTLVESSLDFTLIRDQIGCPHDVDLLTFIDDLDCEQQKKQANSIVFEHENRDAQYAKSLTGLDELLSHIDKINLPSAIVTRNSKAATEQKLQQNNIDIALVLTRECYPAKPAPDALLAIAKQWNIPPKHIVYVGDYLYDIQAAKNAGMLACFINHGKPKSYQHLADIIVENLPHLLTFLCKK